ncbi:36363_t:CDS:2 [Racocetra persica]|uniref:36363_t:CDS:1 n=1 Tax=Racocetra persica TaxID=160502 RepID=A0ACA9P9E7_9GLOM|nr:36363_t:CDS:2 [Racocetra persica]
MPYKPKLKVSSKRKFQLKIARAKFDSQKNNDLRNKINQYLENMNYCQLKQIHDYIIKELNIEATSETDDKRIELISNILQLPDQQVHVATTLFENMRYSKGSNEGKILSPYLQKKAKLYIEQSLYKAGQSSNSLTKANNNLHLENVNLQKTITQLQKSKVTSTQKLQSLSGKISQLTRKRKNQIAKIRANARRPLTDTRSFNAMINSFIMENKKEYKSDFINIMVQMSQVGKSSFRSTVQATQLFLGFLTGKSNSHGSSPQSLVRWHKEVSKLHVSQLSKNMGNSEFFSFAHIIMMGFEETAFGKLPPAAEELKTVRAHKKRKISSETDQHGEDKANETFTTLFIRR